MLPHNTEILGVLNVTPDSFSDGGCYIQPDDALARARQIWDAGADWVDVGAESTRPGAAEVDVDEELRRLGPVFAGLRRDGRRWSIDTQKPAVMRAAVDAGAGMINDVNALQWPGALSACVSLGVPVVLMHRQGKADNMQRAPQYRDVVTEVTAFLRARVDTCIAAGIPQQDIVVDPGIGFGKTLSHNLALLQATRAIRRDTGCRIMIGVSRKSMFRDLLGLEKPEQRVVASAVTAAWCAGQGADFVRVHDVEQTLQALTTWRALNNVYGANE